MVTKNRQDLIPGYKNLSSKKKKEIENFITNIKEKKPNTPRDKETEKRIFDQIKSHINNNNHGLSYYFNRFQYSAIPFVSSIIVVCVVGLFGYNIYNNLYTHNYKEKIEIEIDHTSNSKQTISNIESHKEEQKTKEKTTKVNVLPTKKENNNTLKEENTNINTNTKIEQQEITEKKNNPIKKQPINNTEEKPKRTTHKEIEYNGQLTDKAYHGEKKIYGEDNENKEIEEINLEQNNIQKELTQKTTDTKKNNINTTTVKSTPIETEKTSTSEPTEQEKKEDLVIAISTGVEQQTPKSTTSTTNQSGDTKENIQTKDTIETKEKALDIFYKKHPSRKDTTQKSGFVDTIIHKDGSRTIATIEINENKKQSIYTITCFLLLPDHSLLQQKTLTQERESEKEFIIEQYCKQQ